MKPDFTEPRPSANRACVALGLLLALISIGSARAELATPEQRRACTPDVYRLCAGKIPNVRAITTCLRRQKANLTPAGRCSAVRALEAVSER
jgi:hypothetical protein